MASDSNYYDARQHLNLSQRAYDIINSDRYDYLPRPSFSGMLNRAFSAYFADADATIDSAVERYRELLSEKAASVKDASGKTELIDTLCRLKREELAQKASSYPTEHQFKFQLSCENYELLQTWRDDGDHYRGSVGRYIKAVIEEYAAKPYFEREGIIFAESICLIESLIASETLISLTTGSGDSTRRCFVRPYCICADTGCNYHYLVGMSRESLSVCDEHPASFRISRISRLSPVASHSGKITASQKKLIEGRMKKVGVQFMTQEQETVRVRLSPMGVQQFERQSYLRPACIEKNKNYDGSAEYSFECSPMQALFYFFKFGGDAVILSSEKLREAFKAEYENALKAYCSEEGEP